MRVIAEKIIYCEHGGIADYKKLIRKLDIPFIPAIGMSLCEEDGKKWHLDNITKVDAMLIDEEWIVFVQGKNRVVESMDSWNSIIEEYLAEGWRDWREEEDLNHGDR